ncbi:MAG: hypothetical protein IIA51_11795 [Chloroflexi bacterium]|nr:hypothetical protein [Chloroflexota bacterium]
MQRELDVHGFIKSFTGSHRHVMDYLADEVLDRQPDSIRSFLLRTSVLDRLSGARCDAVTERDGGQATLERIEAQNLPVGGTLSYSRVDEYTTLAPVLISAASSRNRWNTLEEAADLLTRMLELTQRARLRGVRDRGAGAPGPSLRETGEG